MPVFWIRRDGVGQVVRAHRYALAVGLAGRELPGWEMALHECDNPLVCVRVSGAGETGLLHVVAGSQRDNMLRMARVRRGGGRPAIRRRGAGMAAQGGGAVALREAVRHGWDADAVAAALLGSTEPTLW